MTTPSEGKARPSIIDIWEEDLGDYISSYDIRLPVHGLADVARGLKTLYPITIYNLSGDDTSGVAGMLMPDGTFVAAPKPVTEAWFWEHEETDSYIPMPNGAKWDPTRKAFAHSWRKGEVVWDGSAVGSLDFDALDGEEGDFQRQRVFRRNRDVSITGPWPTAVAEHDKAQTSSYKSPAEGGFAPFPDQTTDDGFFNQRAA
jgi:hypothetical protein